VTKCAVTKTCSFSVAILQLVFNQASGEIKISIVLCVNYYGNENMLGQILSNLRSILQTIFTFSDAI